MKNIQELSEFQRKIIFWIAVFIVITIVFYFGFKKIRASLKEFKDEDFWDGIEPPDTEQIREQAKDLEKEFKDLKELGETAIKEIEKEETQNKETSEE